MKYIRSLLVVIVGLFLSGVRRMLAVGGDDDVQSPTDLTKQGWKTTFTLTRRALKNKNLGMAAAALGYYATLTFFPATLGLASLYAAIAGSAALKQLLTKLSLVFPVAIQDLLQTQLGPLTHASHASLGVATIVSVVLLLWTTSGGFQNLVKALNIAYGVKENRNFIKLRLTSIALSAVLITFGVLIVFLLILQGDALHALGAPNQVANLFPILRWPLLIIVLSGALAIIYRYAPNHHEPAWSWVSWGATAATILWLIGTVLFFFYVQHFANFNKSYGSFAGIIILMTWFNLSSMTVLLGAQVNNNLEQVGDTTD